MGCGCGSGGKTSPPLKYQVTFKDGSTITFTTSQEAQTAIRAAKGGSMRAVRG